MPERRDEEAHDDAARPPKETPWGFTLLERRDEEAHDDAVQPPKEQPWGFTLLERRDEETPGDAVQPPNEQPWGFTLLERRDEETPGDAVQPPKEQPRFTAKLLISAALTAALVASAAVAGYGISQSRKSEQRRIAQELADQREAEQSEARRREADQREAERRQAAAQARQEATVAEGRLISAHVADLKAMRAELRSTIDSMRRRAKSSASASREWDRIWARRRASYASRYSAVRAHNARERQLEAESSSGELVIKHTYIPTYWSYPARPKSPAPLRVSVGSEIKRLSKLQGRVGALRSSIVSESPKTRSFGSVYRVLEKTTQALEAAVGDASNAARRVVVSKGAKGQVIDESRIRRVDESSLDASFDELDPLFTDALMAVGLGPEDVTMKGTDPQ